MINEIKQSVTDFVKGGDNSDIMLLNKVLHKDFRVTNNGFIGTTGVTIIDKEKYFGLSGGLHCAVRRDPACAGIEL